MLSIIDINLKTDVKPDKPVAIDAMLMSQDKHNNQFMLRFTNGGETVTLDDTYTVEILSKFTKSGTSLLTSATVHEDYYATWEFDTDYITQEDEVRNYVYVRKSGDLVVSADANCFVFNVDLSEIDKDAGRVAETYDENYEKYLDEFKAVADFTVIQQGEVDRESSETTRKTNETTRISNENARKSAEVIRLANETGRVNAETVRSEFYEGFDGRLDDLEADKVVLKNLIANGDFSNGTIGWSSIGGSTTAESNILSLTSTGGSPLPRTYINIAFVSGRKYYLSLRQRVTNSVANSLRFGTTESVNTVNSPIMNQWYENSVIFDATTDNQLILSNAYSDGVTAIGKVMQVKSVVLIDLTATFGAGNEPSKEWMDRLIEKTGYFDEHILNENWQVGEILRLNDTKANKADLDDLSSLLGWHTAKDVVGLEADFENSIFTRLAGAVGKTAGADFDSLRAFGGRKRCNLTDDGVVLSYFGDVGYTETGQLTQAITKDGVTYPIGTQVQVMVEQPSFYYKVVPLTIEPIVDGKGYHLRKVRYYVSDTKQVGFKLHPAFIRNNKTLTTIYPSAFEGALYDVSASSYNLTDVQAGDFTATTGDKLSSIANAKPASGLTQTLTRPGARHVAQNRGTGWELMYAATAAATQLLLAIEYGTFNTQTAIGMGVSKTDDGATNMSDPTGATSALGNASGEATNGSVSYRGEENFWMNVWSWVDGMNIKPQGLHELYVADHAFADDKGDGSYINVGITVAKANGYVSAFAYNEPFDWLFMPSDTVGGNSSVPVGDHLYQNAVSTAGWLAAALGGYWNNPSNNGGFGWYLYSSSTYRSRIHGARLVYAKGGN